MPYIVTRQQNAGEDYRVVRV